tara:strand:+ start:1739 stop:1990 length:252 start_codon:yes stop_codon:yes gene_type:complete
MDISIFDLCLVNFVSYIFGLGTGLIICCKNKDKLLVKSRSIDNLSLMNNNHTAYPAPIIASAPPPEIVQERSSERPPIEINLK